MITKDSYVVQILKNGFNFKANKEELKEVIDFIKEDLLDNLSRIKCYELIEILTLALKECEPLENIKDTNKSII